ncbi:hypothetical protein BJX70DRAFT_394508 [Aspergillus crustosus]
MELDGLQKSKSIQQDPEKLFRWTKGLEILEKRRSDFQQLLNSGELVRLVRFHNIASNGVTGKLNLLSLEVVVYREDTTRKLATLVGGNWRLIWQSATETLQTVSAALQESGLEVDHLDLFNAPGFQRCSIASNKLSQIDFHTKRLSKTLTSHKSLSISVSDRIIDFTPQHAQESGDPRDDIDFTDRDNDKPTEVVTAEAQDEQNFTGIASLIAACPGLKRLHVHQYLVNFRRIPQVGYPNERLLQCVFALDTLPLLEELTLRGVYVHEPDLLAFINMMPLRKLSLEFMTMVSGKYRSILDYSNTKTSTLGSVYLDELREQNELVHFTGVGEP